MRKIIALVLALMLVVTCFAACGDNGTSSTSSDASTSSAASGDESSEASDTESSEAESSEGEETSSGDVSELNIRIGMEPTSMNTLNSTYSNEFSLINHMYDKLHAG